MRLPLLIAFMVISLLAPAAARAGRIIVNNDEWTTSNVGFTNAGANATTFVQNVANFLLHGGSGGSFLVYSTDFSLTDTDFSTALTSAGHSLTVSTAITFDLPTLQAFDGIFLAGEPGADTSVLTDYVNNGGGVYLAGGTFFGGSATGEAAAWNPFLNNFGLQFDGGSYNGVIGNVAVTGSHPVLNGVSSLYYANGNPISLFGANPNAQIIEFNGDTGNGLLAAFDGPDLQTVPEPGTWSMLLIGLGATVLTLRRRK